MASLKEIKQHIVAGRQTQKLTKAMNMVAASKLRTTQNKAEAYQEYADEVARLLEEIGRRSAVLADSVFTPLKDSDRALLVVFTSDRGLCGSFNANIFSFMLDLLEDIRGRGLAPELYVVGRKGADYWQRYRTTKIHETVVGATSLFDYDQAVEMTGELIDLYNGGGYAEVGLVFTSFKSLTRHVVTYEALLPLSSAHAAKGGAVQAQAAPEASQLGDYIIEPKPAELVNRLVPRSLAIMVYQAMLESVTSENAARMQAMDNASQSCKDIISSLTMSYNKARQAAVTNELLDIVNGAEALKG